jgi:hypothetical protein
MFVWGNLADGLASAVSLTRVLLIALLNPTCAIGLGRQRPAVLADGNFRGGPHSDTRGRLNRSMQHLVTS